MLLVKPEDIHKILKKSNSFDKNIQFIAHKFLSGTVHFLDVNISRNKTEVYLKETDTVQYAHYTINTLWRFKVAWIQSLYHRARKICIKKVLFKNQIWINYKLTAVWSSYPKYINKLILNNIDSYLNKVKPNNETKVKKIWISLLYVGEKGESLIKSTIKIFQGNFEKKVVIITRFNDAKVSIFCSNKNKINFNQKLNVI